MKRKKVFLKRVDCTNQERYTVTKTVNGLEPYVGSSITVEQVKRLIASERTDVIITEG